MDQMHSLLERQLKRHFGARYRISKKWKELIKAIDSAYREFDDDREMLERSLDLSSQELMQANSEMRAIFQSIPDVFFRLDSDGRILSYKAGDTEDFPLQPGQLLGKRIQDIPLKEVREKFAEAIRRVQETKSVASVEYSMAIHNQIQIYEARALPLLENQTILIVRNITERKRAEEAIRKGEESQRFFSERLTRVVDTLNILTKIESFDELCRRSVELAIERLGFDRVGLCFLSEDQRTLLGTYGTDEIGRLRNEKNLRRPVDDIPTVKKLLKNPESVLFFEEEPLYNDRLDRVGIGDHAIARLWNKEKIIGIYAVDNLIRRTPITNEDLKILDIYGTSMGHLFTLKQAEESIRKLNEELEHRVAERTAQLELANKELEAFTYSVSHDLRAPLRAIDGFTHILEEDYGKALNEEGKRVCTTICSETQRMGQLIDDLLSFSRVSRADMRVTPINMEALASSVFYELTTPEDRGRIDFHVGGLPGAVGDPTLIREVWMNLLSNAIKFSSKRERAEVEVGYREEGEKVIYYVKDNGAGFDMRYADKLFTVFWRLHSEKEFEGTGVGLAIVQRLVHRHGGKVWADSQVDNGATFFFTLGE